MTRCWSISGLFALCWHRPWGGLGLSGAALGRSWAWRGCWWPAREHDPEYYGDGWRCEFDG